MIYEIYLGFYMLTFGCKILIFQKTNIFWLVSLFNGISTFVGDLIPKLSLQKNSRSTMQRIAEGNKEVHAFPKGISLIANVIG